MSRLHRNSLWARGTPAAIRDQQAGDVIDLGEEQARACRLCGNAVGNRTLAVREMMFGYRDEFNYVECHACGCLQLETPPRDLTKYYPREYYAYTPVREPLLPRRLALRHRYAQSAGKVDTPLGRFLVKRFGAPWLPAWFKHLALERSDAVLDIGCGSGSLLVQLSTLGFQRLTGLDPYIDRDLFYRCGVRVLKRGLSEHDDRCDLAMFHHSFEHLANPAETLRVLARVVARGGMVLIRTPVAGTHAWRTYGTHWFQIDAPRHLFVHTEASIALLATGAGFAVEAVVYDSTWRQFGVSELYRRGIPLRRPGAHQADPAQAHFSPEERARFENEAQALNRKGQGDQACFYLRRV